MGIGGGKAVDVRREVNAHVNSHIGGMTCCMTKQYIQGMAQSNQIINPRLH